MKKIIVYRLENIRGFGPFRGGHRMEAELLKAHLGIRQCLVDRSKVKPRAFKKLSKAGWNCAWSSESDFDLWMNDQTEFFENLGYFKVRYEIEQYKLCGDQELCQYDETLEDFLYFDIDGYQVFYNPKRALKVS